MLYAAVLAVKQRVTNEFKKVKNVLAKMRFLLTFVTRLIKRLVVI